MSNVVVLGGGIAGLSAAFFLKERGIQAALYEEKGECGGLCRSFRVEGFTFDTFAHVNFGKETSKWMEKRTRCYEYVPEAYNYDKGRWLKHPIQEHLYGLSVEERIEILLSFLERNTVDESNNYAEWLCSNYGKVFAERFPYRYTRKYWTLSPEMMETRWTKGRMNEVSLEKLLFGAMSDDEPPSHYSGKITYPKSGGFQSFLKPLMKDIDIHTGRRAVEIDITKKEIRFEDGEKTTYSQLISTIPLTEICKMIVDVPQKVVEASAGLYYTQGVQVSIGVKGEIVTPGLWFYIYDENILASRVFMPGRASNGNVPPGCSSLQAEIYYSSFRPRKNSLEEIKKMCIADMIGMGLFKSDQIMVSDVREERFANIIFTPQIYDKRSMVLDYLTQNGIVSAGRFGEWDYLWAGKSLLSGKQAAEKIMEQIKNE